MKPLNKEVINWLLEKNNPPVRYLTLKNLLKDEPGAEESKKHLMEYAVTQGILGHFDEFIDHNDKKAYWKYKGRFWQTIFLGQFLADGDHPGITALAGKLIGNRNWMWKNAGSCLTANLLAALIRLGFGDSPYVKEECEKLARQVAADGGVNCTAMLYSLLTQCYMAIPKALLCFSEIPEQERSPAVKKAIEILVERLLENEVYMYVSGNRGSWQKILEKQPKRTELPPGQTVKAWILEQKEKFLENPGFGEHEGKQGWFKFAFPLHYNSDILESMYALARLGAPMDSRLKKPLQVIKDKQTPGGKWVMENSLNGKMWIDVEKKGKPSKWLTYFALFVLDHFGPEVN